MNAHFHADPLRPPATIAEYLDRLRAALAGADPALVQDALYDAEDYLRSEMAANPGRSEAEVIAAVAGSYGAPDEVADIYRDTEVRVQTALQPPKRRKPRTTLGQFFGVALEPRTYAALFYMLLSLATGIFYFTWVVTGASLSLGLSVLIIGVPFAILFFGSVRVLSLVEGRLVEAMLGERMPRRPLYASTNATLMGRIAEMFTDPRTWATMLYMLLMLPLGILRHAAHSARHRTPACAAGQAHAGAGGQPPRRLTGRTSATRKGAPGRPFVVWLPATAGSTSPRALRRTRAASDTPGCASGAR